MYCKRLTYFLFACALCISVALPCHAQRVIQYSAELLSADSTKPVAFATIFDRKTGQGTRSNQQGFFSIVTLPGDSIDITSIGFHKLIVVIPPTVNTDKLGETLYMYAQAYNLSAVLILPFTRDQFRYAFVHSNVPHDDLSRAYANLNPAVMRRIGREMSPDGREIGDMVLHQYASNYSYAGQRQPMNILSPLAWYQFFQTLNNGGFKNPDDNTK